MSVDKETRPFRVQPMNNFNIVSHTDDLVPSSYIVSPLNARRASIEDISMRVSPGRTSLQLLVPTHYKTKKKGLQWHLLPITTVCSKALQILLNMAVSYFPEYNMQSFQLLFDGIQNNENF
jgi:hypothetical protein